MPFESQDAIDLFVALVQAGFYTPEVSALAEETTAAAEIAQENGRIVVTVGAAQPLNRGTVIDSRARWVSHELAVRGGRNWRTVRWNEPDPPRAPELRAIAAIARRLHEAVMRVEKGIQPGDVCLS